MVPEKRAKDMVMACKNGQTPHPAGATGITIK